MEFNKQQFQSRGFVILFTIIISVIIFMMGLGIYSIALRQTILSGTSREAQQAFYSADAGIECALRAEQLGHLINGGDIDCNTAQITIDPGNNPIVFYVGVGDDDSGPCARVNVFNENGARRVISQGFNRCEEGVPNTNDPRLVERDLDVTYPTTIP